MSIIPFVMEHDIFVMILSVFNFNYLGGCVVISHCGFNLHFPDDDYVKHLLYASCPFSMFFYLSYWILLLWMGILNIFSSLLKSSLCSLFFSLIQLTFL